MCDGMVHYGDGENIKSLVFLNFKCKYESARMLRREELEPKMMESEAG